jgi:hypothetical protein
MDKHIGATWCGKSERCHLSQPNAVLRGRRHGLPLRIRMDHRQFQWWRYLDAAGQRSPELVQRHCLFDHHKLRRGRRKHRSGECFASPFGRRDSGRRAALVIFDPSCGNRPCLRRGMCLIDCVRRGGFNSRSYGRWRGKLDPWFFASRSRGHCVSHMPDHGVLHHRWCRTRSGVIIALHEFG